MAENCLKGGFMGDNNLKGEHFVELPSHYKANSHYENLYNHIPISYNHGELNPSNYDWSKGGYLICYLDSHTKKIKFKEVESINE